MKKRFVVQCFVALIVLCLVSTLMTGAASAKVIVTPSADSPTGYFVTFQYTDPNATRVRLYGEWWFSDLAHASVRTSLNATPEQWKDGYTVWKGSKPWPTVDMTKGADGVWSYTIPLPTGTWNYRFYVGGAPDAALTDYKDAKVTWDPENRPMLYDYEAKDLTNDEYLSHVYVPWDANKQANTMRRDEEAPRTSEQGKAFFSEVTMPDGFKASFGVYLPYGFDAQRAEPYPVLVIMHGGGGSESGWFNNGLVNILDNMIAAGRLEPTVVVTPNGEDAKWNRPLILDSVVNYILPYMVEKYHVSKDPQRRAFGGLSMGGATTMYAFFHNTNDFQYFLPMSPPMLEDVKPDYAITNLSKRTLWFAYGLYDFVKLRSLYSLFPDAEGKMVLLSPARRPEGSAYEYLIKLSEAGVPFTNLELPFGHDWVLWRKAIVYAFDNVLWK